MKLFTNILICTKSRCRHLSCGFSFKT